MPLFDVHLRMPVRFKFRDVEAETAEEALLKAMHDPARMELAGREVQRSYDSGLIADIDLDEADVISALVDLVGDEQYLHTVDFDMDPDGNPRPYDASARGIVSAVGVAAHAAAGTSAPTPGGAAPDALSALVEALFGSTPVGETDHAVRDVDAAIAALTRARDAAAQIAAGASA